MKLIILFIGITIAISIRFFVEYANTNTYLITTCIFYGALVSALICLAFLLICIFNSATNKDALTEPTKVVTLSPIYEDNYVIVDSKNVAYKQEDEDFPKSAALDNCQFKTCGNGSYEVPTIEIYNIEYTNPFTQFMLGPVADYVYKIYLPAEGGGL